MYGLLDKHGLVLPRSFTCLPANEVGEGVIPAIGSRASTTTGEERDTIPDAGSPYAVGDERA